MAPMSTIGWIENSWFGILAIIGCLKKGVGSYCSMGLVFNVCGLVFINCKVFL